MLNLPGLVKDLDLRQLSVPKVTILAVHLQDPDVLHLKGAAASLLRPAHRPHSFRGVWTLQVPSVAC